MRLAEAVTVRAGKYLPKDAYVPNGQFFVYGSNSIMGRYDQALVQTPHVVMAAVGANAGAVRYSAQPSWINNNAFAVVPGPNVDAFFLYLWLQAGLDVSQVLAGTGQPYVKRPLLLAQSIPLPTMPEQRRIVDLIRALDAQSERLAQEVSALRRLRSQLLPSLLCGEIEIPASYVTGLTEAV